MGFFSKRAKLSTVDERLQRQSCTGCSSCFSKPIESMPAPVQDKLEGIRKKLIESRDLYNGGKRGDAVAAAREVKRLVAQLSASGDFRSSIDSMFAAHVPEPEIQLFIARS